MYTYCTNNPLIYIDPTGYSGQHGGLLGTLQYWINVLMRLLSGEYFDIFDTETMEVSWWDEHKSNFDVEDYSYINRSFKQVLLGNYTDDVTLLGTAGQIGLGIAGLDLPMDIRDLYYDLTHFKWKWSHIRQTAIDVIAFIPVIGGLKYMDELSALKHLDELKDGLKYTDELTDGIKHTDALTDGARYANKGTDGLKYSDEALSSSKHTDEALGGVCFVAGTIVVAQNGDVKIEDIHAGMLVWAKNPETGEEAFKEVVRIFENETDELVHLFVEGEKITTTPEHPFYVQNKGWIRAIQLRAGDILVVVNGEYVVLEKVQHEILEAPIKVYNFEVKDFHTYFVGENSVLVHNSCKADTLTSKGYYQDANGRWHRPNGQYASNKEVGLPEPQKKYSSGTLANNMKNAYGEHPGMAAHHIVPRTLSGAKEAREVLKQYGIDIDSVDNGVYLPTDKSYNGPAMYHPSLHTEEYVDKINAAFENVRSREDAINKLESIRSQLLDGTF